MQSHDPMRLIRPYRNKRVLITGGSGYLAHNLAKRLALIPCALMRLFRKGGSKPIGLPGKKADIGDIICDINDYKFWVKALKGVDYVFHFAAQTSVYAANRDPQADMQVNVMPMVYMLEACRIRGYRPTVIFAGTSTEAGMPEIVPVKEDCPDRPITVYDIHKLMAEKYLLAYARNGFVKGVTLRLSNVYGPGPQSSSADRGVLNSMISRALEGEPLTIYGKGEHRRDYIFIGDAIGAFFAAGAKIGRTNGNYYIIGSGIGRRIADAINLIARRVALKAGLIPKVTHVTPPRGLSRIETRDFVADTHKFRKATGWSPAVSLRDGIDITIGYYQKMKALPSA